MSGSINAVAADHEIQLNNLSYYPTITVISDKDEPCFLHSYLRETFATVFIFVPYLFGKMSREKTVHCLLQSINKSIEAFVERDIRVVCVTRDSTCTIRYWMQKYNIQFDVVRDPNLELSRLFGKLTDYFKHINLEIGREYSECAPYALSQSGVLIIGGSIGSIGTIIGSSISHDLESFGLDTFDVLKMTGHMDKQE